MNFLRRYKLQIVSAVLAFFLLSIVMGFGSSFFVKGAPNDAVAKLDGDKITIREFLVHYSRSVDRLQPGTSMTDDMRQQFMQEALRSIIQMRIFERESNRHGIRVPDTQVVNSLGQMFRNPETNTFDPQAYSRFLQTQAHTGPKSFEEEQRQSIAFFKLRWLIQSTQHLTTTEINQAWANRGADFVKQNEFEMKDGKKSRKRTPVELQQLFQQQLTDEKNNWALNQWFTQLGQKMKVQTYFDRVQGQLR